MPDKSFPKFRIYPPIGIARLGNGPAEKDDVIFSPEVPWANLYETDLEYLTDKGEIKKQAQRFHIYECDKKGKPVKRIDAREYDINWSVEVANKKPFWYDFNNCLDLSVTIKNHNNLSPRFAAKELAPSISTERRNPNVLDEGQRVKGGYDFRKELINSPGIFTVKEGDACARRKQIRGMFPSHEGVHKLASQLNTESVPVNLGTIEYDNGTLIFYGADGISAALNKSDLNTDFADNSNWYDDICDGRVTATITRKKDKKTFKLMDSSSAAWIATAPPDYAPQIQPISTMFDLITGAANDSSPKCEFSLIFPMLYRLYRMQWVNLGDFLSPSFRETMDKLTSEGKLKYLYLKKPEKEAQAVRDEIFNLFRDPSYNYDNEPIIPNASTTDINNVGSGTEELKLPYYPGDGVDYPGSPAQWFAIPPLLFDQLKKWRDGKFEIPEKLKPKTLKSMDDIGAFFQKQFHLASKEEKMRPLLMTRAVLETLYGGGFHPGVELTWPMRHDEIYSENKLIYKSVHADIGLFGLREIRLNTATPKKQKEIFYNDFGFQMNGIDVQESLKKNSKKHWLWELTPGDLTKWMGIPWQSDAGSCQDVFVDKQYPTPAWWAANLPVNVLTEDSFEKLKDPQVLDTTKQYIYGNRLPWLRTTDTGFIGYHAEGGYINGLINMVYQWKDIGMVTGRKLDSPTHRIPSIVYVAFNGKNKG